MGESDPHGAHSSVNGQGPWEMERGRMEKAHEVSDLFLSHVDPEPKNVSSIPYGCHFLWG